MHDKAAKGRAPKGDNHPARLHPERLVRGERHHWYTHPELLPRGDDHWARRHPELVARGEAHHQAKLNQAAADLIRSRYHDGISMRSLADEFGVSKTTIRDIVQNRRWIG
jgi:hypothetical protein